MALAENGLVAAIIPAWLKLLFCFRFRRFCFRFFSKLNFLPDWLFARCFSDGFEFFL